MRKIILIVAIVLLKFPVFSLGQNLESTIKEAETYYNQADFDAASDAYLKVLQAGYHSADIYYNLGNTYFKQNKFPPGILYYEKALKLDPSNENVLFNLKLANTKIQDKIDAVPQLFFIRWYVSLYNMYSVDKWAKISLILFAIAALFSLLYFLGKNIAIRKTGFYFGFIFLFLMSSALFLSYKKNVSQKEQAFAIVFTPAVTVKSSPTHNGVDLFVIHEGTKLQIIDKVGEWCEVKIANGSVGWIEKQNLRII